jgi:hypothetical protein
MGGEAKGGQDGRTHKGNTIDDIPLWTLAWTYWGFICAILTAHFRRLIFWVCTWLGFLQEDSAFLSAAVLGQSWIVQRFTCAFRLILCTTGRVPSVEGKGVLLHALHVWKDPRLLGSPDLQPARPLVPAHGAHLRLQHIWHLHLHRREGAWDQSRFLQLPRLRRERWHLHRPRHRCRECLRRRPCWAQD